MSLEFKFPDVGEGITEGEIVKWLVKEGDTVEEHQNIVEIETDKAVVEIPSPASGKILKISHKEGDTIKVGETLVIIGAEGEASIEKTTPAESQKAKKSSKKTSSIVGEIEEDNKIIPNESQSTNVRQESVNLALPAVRRLAVDLGVDLSNIKGTGLNNRITEEDVRKASDKKSEEPEELPDVKITKKYNMWGYVERVPMKGVRKTIAKHMVQSLFTATHVTHMDEADVTELFKIREREKEKMKQKGIHLTFLPFVVKACIEALKDHPYFNAELNDELEEVIIKKYYNIGIAVDTEEGLVVPVVKGADQKSIANVALEIQNLSEKVKNKQIDLADLKGGSFTITNIGSIGGIHATPIINYPESAILAMGAITDQVRVINGSVKIRKILPLSLAFDHRIVDGAEAARFMNVLKENLEDPSLLLIE